MGKVGSTAVTHGLRESSLGRPVVHVHQLNPDHLGRVDRWARARYSHSGTISPVALDAMYLGPRLAEMMKHRKLDIVTMVRDPIGRNLSGFFQSLAATHPDLAARLAGDPAEACLAEARELFRRTRLGEDPWSWFDEELRALTGLDLFAHEFDPERGWAIYENDRCRVLLVRFSDLSAVFARAANEFLGVADVELPRRNEASSRATAAAHARLQADLGLTVEEVEAVYDDDRMRHWYTDDEIGSLVEKWSKPVTAG